MFFNTSRPPRREQPEPLTAMEASLMRGAKYRLRIRRAGVTDKMTRNEHLIDTQEVEDVIRRGGGLKENVNPRG